VVRKENGALEKVQCKYTTSDGRVVEANVRSASAWVHHRYTPEEVDWIGVYDATTNQCFYIPSSVWDGHIAVSLRLAPTANGQVKGVRDATDFTEVSGNPSMTPPGSAESPPLPFDRPPE
jgi:hypothetical protein